MKKSSCLRPNPPSCNLRWSPSVRLHLDAFHPISSKFDIYVYIMPINLLNMGYSPMYNARIATATVMSFALGHYFKTMYDIVPHPFIPKLVRVQRYRYNQVPHLTQDTNGKVTNSQLDTTNESQEVSPFPAGDHKAHINRRAQRHSKHKTE